MDTLYNRNGLVFWNEKEIRLRNMIVDYFVRELGVVLKKENKAFEMVQVEAPILTPEELINKNYTQKDVYFVAEAGGDEEKLDLFGLRPETTMGSYKYGQWLLDHTENKIRLPICIWQHGKSFRREQDQVTKNMRLKEFYQLEFQCMYGTNTANDYSKAVIPAVQKMISEMIGHCKVEESDRLPDYSEKTVDIVCESNNMEVCSISKRKDCVWKSIGGTLGQASVLEVAIGTDRCVYNFLNK
jgi:glycyl-tRNA synthetase